MNDTEVKNSNNSLVLIVDHVEMRRTMIGVVHLDDDSVEPAYRRHARRLPFELVRVNFPARAYALPKVPTCTTDEREVLASPKFDSPEAHIT